MSKNDRILELESKVEALESSIETLENWIFDEVDEPKRDKYGFVWGRPRPTIKGDVEAIKDHLGIVVEVVKHKCSPVKAIKKGKK